MSIVAYLGQLLKGQEPCYRLKVMFVGQENVGYFSPNDMPLPHLLHVADLHSVAIVAKRRSCAHCSARA
jgi:hypothetical protein